MKPPVRRLVPGLLVAVGALLGSACAPPDPLPDGETGIPGSEGWIPLFNGQDLEGWTPKIRGQPAGDDPWRTFRVVPDAGDRPGSAPRIAGEAVPPAAAGVLAVSYADYAGAFGDRFGHLFYREPFTHYDLLVEYRFLGEQVPGAPGWAWRNSGVMLHAQAPETMGRDQDFPISVEAQFLGGDGAQTRPTANVCTPGTEVRINGERVPSHCVEAAAPTIPGDRWVTVVLRVRGSREVTHHVAGEEVLRYTELEVGGGAVSGHDPAIKIDGTPLGGGFIALQSEGHPIEFRRVWIRPVRP